MTVKETELLIMESIRSIAKDQYPVCCGIIPLVRKNGIGITLKNLSSGNQHSDECTLTITVKSEKRDSLLAVSDLIRTNIVLSAADGVIIEIPRQDIAVEGVKNLSSWVWQSSFDIKITTSAN
ncbi:MAG: hypothetical protein IKD29_07035 [Lentisphaeria bacterium]|nr:hypothetical protein [Lentisphaeria bacterium]